MMDTKYSSICRRGAAAAYSHVRFYVDVAVGRCG